LLSNIQGNFTSFYLLVCWFCSPYKFDKNRGEAFIFNPLSPDFIEAVSMKFSLYKGYENY